MSKLPYLLVLALPLTLAACGIFQPKDKYDGHTLYDQNCAYCHGADGKGTPAGLALTTPVKDLTLIAKNNGGKFPWIDVMSTIDGYSKGSHSSAMPEFGSLDLGPMVMVEPEPGVSTPVPQGLGALAFYLYGIQSQN